MEDDSDDGDLVFEGDTLTQAIVAKACDANESYYSTRFRTSISTIKISVRDKGKAPIQVSDFKSSQACVQLIDEDEKEGEEDDIGDDVEMVDDDDDAEHVVLDEDVDGNAQTQLTPREVCELFALCDMRYMLSFYEYACLCHLRLLLSHSVCLETL